MDLLETYQKSVWIITYLKKLPRGGAVGQGVNLDDIVRAIRLKRKDIYPVNRLFNQRRVYRKT